MPNTTILWNENSPADSDGASGGAGDIRSLKTSLRNALGQEHLWPNATGLAGAHLLGSGRAFYDVQSNVSSADTMGRLYVASDTSNFFHVGSNGTMFLGGQRVISANSSPVGGQRFYWAVEFGSQTDAASGARTISFPNSGYSGAPFVFVSTYTAGVLANQAYVAWVSTVTTGGFVAQLRTLTSAGVTIADTIGLNWLSIGTRSL